MSVERKEKSHAFFYWLVDLGSILSIGQIETFSAIPGRLGIEASMEVRWSSVVLLKPL